MLLSTAVKFAWLLVSTYNSQKVDIFRISHIVPQFAIILPFGEETGQRGCTALVRVRDSKQLQYVSMVTNLRP